MTLRRFFAFDGNDSDYIAFLERKVIESSKVIEAYGGPATITYQHGVYDTTAVPSRSSRYFSRTANGEDEGYESSGLQIIEYVPCNAHTSTAKIRCSKPDTRWQKDLDKLILSIPCLDSWDQERAELALPSEVVLRIVVNRDSLSEKPSPLYAQRLPYQANIISALNEYCSFTKSALGHARIAKLVALFSELIFVSFCAVALKTVDDAESVYTVMRNYISNAQTKHLDKLVRGSLWANNCISELHGTGWELRSSEVFLLGGQSVAFYSRYAENLKSREYFLDEMKKKAAGRRSFRNNPPAPILLIPLIIERLACGTLQLSKICEVLGYNLDLVASCRSYYDRALNGPPEPNPEFHPSCANKPDTASSETNPSAVNPLPDYLEGQAWQFRTRQNTSSESTSNTDLGLHLQAFSLPRRGRGVDSMSQSGPFQVTSYDLDDSTTGSIDDRLSSEQLPYGPQPGEPGSLAVDYYLHGILQNHSHIFPSPPDPGDPGSLAINDRSIPRQNFPDRFPCAPEPGAPGSLAIDYSWYDLLQDRSNSPPYPPQPHEPGSFAIRRYHMPSQSRQNNLVMDLQRDW